MAGSSNVKVHLDHLIQRESLRWVDAKADVPNPVVSAAVPRNDNLTKLSYQDIDVRYNPETVRRWLHAH